MRRKITGAALAVAATLSIAAPAHAQMAVVDVRSIAQALQTARNTLQQLQEAQRLYSALNSVSQIRSVSNLLDSPILQSALPDGMQQSVSLISGDLRDLGAIGNRAESILGNNDFSLSGLDYTLGNAQGALNRATTASARDQAYGEYMLDATEATGDGLKQLNTGLSSATTLREAQDIAARAAIENAGINNRLLQMQAAEQAARAAMATKSSADFAASQRRTQENIDSGKIWPTWNGN